MFDFKKIDAFLNRCNLASDDAALRREFGTYHAEYDMNLPLDAFSQQYSRRQMEIYELLAGKSYSSANELTTIDAASAATAPFPYCSGSCELVGNQLIAIGQLIKALSLPKGATVLEFGPGWGNTTIVLAKMGMAVTVVDVEKNFCDLIAARALAENLNIKIINSDFSYINKISTRYDAVLFFECFHHAPDHRALMAAFDHVVVPGGIVCFGAEPITPDFPIPWGLRMDGESIWAIRRNGWFELGFNEQYFEEAMRRHGWFLTWNSSRDCAWASVVIARRSGELDRTFRFRDGQLLSKIGIVGENGAICSSGESGYLIHGPYIDLPRGKYIAIFVVDKSARLAGVVDFDVSTAAGTSVCATKTVDLSRTKQASIELEFSLETRRYAVETRIRCHAGAQLSVTEVLIRLQQFENG